MFPCYNDSRIIVNLIHEVTEHLEKYTEDFEVIVVDDFSSDNSRDILLKEKANNKKLVLIFHDKNMGYGKTIIDGMKIAKFPYFFYTDGDGQYSVSDIIHLIDSMDEDTILANGYKISRDDPFYRILIGKIYNLMMKFFFGIKIRDIDCDFRIIKKSVFDDVKFFSKSGTICIEIVKRIEIETNKTKEVPVKHFKRRYGSSQFFNIKRLLFVSFYLIGLWNILIAKRK